MLNMPIAGYNLFAAGSTARINAVEPGNSMMPRLAWRGTRCG